MTPHSIGVFHSLHLGVVVKNDDPESRGRIQVELQSAEMRVWASVVSLSAGQGYGTSFIPKVDEIVVLAFITPELPLILGSIWTGQSSMVGEADKVEDNYVIKTPSGSIVHFNDGAQAKINIQTPNEHHITIYDGNGGEIEIVKGGESIKLSPSGIDIQTQAQVNVNASTVTVTASSLTVNAGMSKFSGVVQADTVITNAVVSSSYTPGAGNVW